MIMVDPTIETALNASKTLRMMFFPFPLRVDQCRMRNVLPSNLVAWRVESAMNRARETLCRAAGMCTLSTLSTGPTNAFVLGATRLW
jgi:hypothetical protein